MVGLSKLPSYNSIIYQQNAVYEARIFGVVQPGLNASKPFVIDDFVVSNVASSPIEDHHCWPIDYAMPQKNGQQLALSEHLFPQSTGLELE